MELLCGFVIIQRGHVLSHYSISFNQSGDQTGKAVGFYQVPPPQIPF